MKAFWWFKENAVAGMARPGFNGTHLFDLGFDELTLWGWLGQHSCGEVSLAEFRTHLKTYMPRVFALIQMDLVEGNQKVKKFETANGFSDALAVLNQKTNFFDSFQVAEDKVKFKLNKQQLQVEIDFLKSEGISTIVALTEKHHQRDELTSHFDTHHISIDDMTAPTLSQAKELAQIFETARSQDKKVAVHCLAGIGRTSTMIIAAHKLLGEDLDQLIAQMKACNPSYKFSGSQAAFLESLR